VVEKLKIRAGCISKGVLALLLTPTVEPGSETKQEGSTDDINSSRSGEGEGEATVSDIRGRCSVIIVGTGGARRGGFTVMYWSVKE